MNKIIADIQFAPSGGFTGFGPLGNLNGSNGVHALTQIISTAIGVMTIVAFIWFVFNFIIGAIGIMLAGGDKQALENARKRISNGIIGVVVVIMAVSVISLVGAIFNIPFLNLPLLFIQAIPGGSTSSFPSGGGGILR